MKPEWGTRRVCKDCQAAFYDMNKDPITCPKCQKVHKEKDFAGKPSLSLNNEIPDEAPLQPITISTETTAETKYVPQNDDIAELEGEGGDLTYQSDFLLTRKISNNLEG